MAFRPFLLMFLLTSIQVGSYAAMLNLGADLKNIFIMSSRLAHSHPRISYAVAIYETESRMSIPIDAAEKRTDSSHEKSYLHFCFITITLHYISPRHRFRLRL